MIVVEASFEIESTDIFSDVLFCPLHGTFGFLTIYKSINFKFFQLPQYLTFQIILCFIFIFIFCCSCQDCIPILVIAFKYKA